MEIDSTRRGPMYTRSKRSRVKKTAVNRLAAMPIMRETAKPLTGPVPNWKRMSRRDEHGDVGVDDGLERAREPRADGHPHRLAAPQLLADALEDEDVGVHRHAHGERDAGDARQRQRRAERGHHREQDEQVQDQRDVGDEAGEPVVDQHERRTTSGGRGQRWRRRPGGWSRAPSEGPPCAPPGSAPARGARPRAARWRGRWPPRSVKPPVMLRLARRDALADHRRGVDVAVEDDGELPADVGLGELARRPGAGGVELDGHVQGSLRVLVDRHARRVARSAPVRQRASSRPRTGHASPAGSACRSGAGRGPPGPRAPPWRDRAVDVRALDHELELEQRRLADEGLGAVGILDAGQLDEDAVVALLRGSTARPRRTGRCGCGSSPAPAGPRAPAASTPRAERRASTSRPAAWSASLHLELGELGGHGLGARSSVWGEASSTDELRRCSRRSIRRRRCPSCSRRGRRSVGRALDLRLERLVQVHAEHQMDAALQVEAEVERPRQDAGHRGRATLRIQELTHARGG